MKTTRIKRSQVLFVTVVFLALLAGFAVEHSNRVDPFARSFARQTAPTLEPLEVPTGRHSLSGTVVNIGGRSAPNVGVFLYRSEPIPGIAEPLLWQYTDESGGFRLTGVPAGDYDVALIRPGHENTRFSLAVEGDLSELRWVLPDTLPPIPVLPVIERAELVGFLLPPVGFSVEEYPVGGYEVVLRPGATVHPLSGAVVRRVVTDAGGRFRIDGLVAAAYHVEVLPPWALGGSWPVLERVYHVLEPEPPADAELRLRLRCGILRGGAEDLAGEAIEGALVKLWPIDEPGRIWPAQATDPRGRFRFEDLPEGRYRVRIRSGAAAQESEAEIRIGSRIEVGFEPMEPRSQAERP